MTDVLIRKSGQIGQITMNRPKALNAITADMCADIYAALGDWANDDNVKMVLFDATGDRAFCAGGDISDLYHTAKAGDYASGQKFWRDEYRLNARIFEFPKPVVSLMQGFTMGGGVGIGCHASHRVVGDTSQIAMPECGIGLVPDVGGSLILSRAPGRLGEYLGITGTRMGPGDAIHAGFADYFIPQSQWPTLTDKLIETGDWTRVDACAEPAPDAPLAALQPEIDSHFGGETLSDILRSLRHSSTDFAARAIQKLNRNAPLAMACAVQIIHRVRGADTIRRSLEQEYRFTHRAAQQGDIIEGIRAQIIDKDRSAHWAHDIPDQVTGAEVTKMLMPLGKDALTFTGDTS